MHKINRTAKDPITTSILWEKSKPIMISSILRRLTSVSLSTWEWGESPNSPHIPYPLKEGALFCFAKYESLPGKWVPDGIYESFYDCSFCGLADACHRA